ncbi:hypothetical protein [Caldimonas sp. KR1-144]|uniref:hypothetical protein n=1 Tax=Caldimonas sp. KR1-144 TaxID=3400911 RepID=UPI003C0CD1D2
MANTAKQAAISTAQLQATQVLTRFIEARSGLSATQLESKLAVGGVLDNKKATKPKKTGTTWRRWRDGRKAASPRTLARLAHDAIKFGWLGPADLIDLQLVAGGWRALDPVHDVLLRMERGETFSASSLDRHDHEWRARYEVSSKRITDERNGLAKKCSSAAKLLLQASLALQDLQDAIRNAHSHDIAIEPTSFAKLPDMQDDPELGFDANLTEFAVVGKHLGELAVNIRSAALVEAQALGMNDLPPPKVDLPDTVPNAACVAMVADHAPTADELSTQRLIAKWLESHVGTHAATELPQTEVETNRPQSKPRKTKTK